MLFRPLVLALSVMPAAADDAFDLSLPFVQRPEYNNQTTFLDDVAQISGIKTAMLLYDSEVVFDYARADTESDGGLDSLQIQWSVTKTWSSFLIGVLIDEGYLASEHVTLEEIFTDSDYTGPGRCQTRLKTIGAGAPTQRPGIGVLVGVARDPDSRSRRSTFAGLPRPGSFSYANPSILAYIIASSRARRRSSSRRRPALCRPRHRARRLDLGAKRRRDQMFGYGYTPRRADDKARAALHAARKVGRNASRLAAWVPPETRTWDRR